MNTILLQVSPAPPLAAYVERLWASERPALAHARERSLPSGRVNLIVPLLQTHVIRYDGEDRLQRLHGPVLQGACDRYLLRGGTDRPSMAVGVQFRPGAAAAFLGLPMGELHDLTVPLDSLWGPDAWELHDRLLALTGARARLVALEAWLCRRLLRTGVPPLLDDAVCQAVAQFDARPAFARVEAVRAATGLSPARFIARFRDAVGQTPKRYARVCRLQAVLHAVAARDGIDWAELALDAGYADQAHLAHEFRRLTGTTPSAYRPVSAAQVNHVAFETAAKKSTRHGSPAAASSPHDRSRSSR